jgi:uncharacterized alkaline shock family protein YloU
MSIDCELLNEKFNVVKYISLTNNDNDSTGIELTSSVDFGNRISGTVESKRHVVQGILWTYSKPILSIGSSSQ